MHKTIRLASLPPWAHWGTDRLKLEKAKNPRAYARGFEMQAFSDTERKFPSLQTCFTHGVVTGELSRRGLPAFVGVDLSGTGRPGNCIVVVGLDYATQRRTLLEVQHGAWRAPELVKVLADINSRHQVKFIMVENNGTQQMLVDFIHSGITEANSWRYKVEPFTTGKNKANPEYGVASLEIEFKNKAWVIPADEFEGHPVDCLCSWCEWVLQMRDYPVAAYDDFVMATWFAREAISKWGGYTAGGGTNIGDINTR
jgi:hypothetical protein